ELHNPVVIAPALLGLTLLCRSDVAHSRLELHNLFVEHGSPPDCHTSCLSHGAFMPFKFDFDTSATVAQEQHSVGALAQTPPRRGTPWGLVMAAQDHREACGPARHHGDVEPHKQVGLSPLVASRRPRGAERNGLAWKPVAEDHRTGVEGIEGRNEPEEAGTRGAKGLW